MAQLLQTSFAIRARIWHHHKVAGPHCPQATTGAARNVHNVAVDGPLAAIIPRGQFLDQFQPHASVKGEEASHQLLHRFIEPALQCRYLSFRSTIGFYIAKQAGTLDSAVLQVPANQHRDIVLGQRSARRMVPWMQAS